MDVARWFFVISVAALLLGCGMRDADIADDAEPAWTAEQLQAFEELKSADRHKRAAVADQVARSFPAAFNPDELRIAPGEAGSVPQERLVELLGRPSVSFSLVDRPEYLGASNRRLDFDPRELHILLYDVDCLAESTSQDCAHLEAISLRQKVLRVRVLRGRREDARTLLSQPAASPVRPMATRLVADMPRPGWKMLPPAEANELARQFIRETLDAEFYQHVDAAYGRMLTPFQLIKTSESEGVCVASAIDVFIPSLRQSAEAAELRRDANIRVAVFEPTLEACRRRYSEGQFVLVKGESLAAAQLVRIHDLFSRRFASECNVPTWMTPHGLLTATGGAYRISVAPPVSGRDRWAFDVTVDFTPDKGGDYSALIAISPWGTRLKECRQSVVPRTIKSG